MNYYFGKWRDDGTWIALNTVLVACDRQRQGRKPEPSLGVIDSQSVKSSDIREERGADGYKKVKGRKRQLFTDSQGHLLTAIAQAANVSDAIGGEEVLACGLEAYPSIAKVLADQAYRGPLEVWALQEDNVVLEIVRPPAEPSNRFSAFIARRTG